MLEFIPGVRFSASALEAERVRMEVISQNIANAYTTRGPDGQPYKRQLVVFESVLQGKLRRINESQPAEVRVARIATDPRPFRYVYQPGHPDADPAGFVSYPNVNLYEEMADLIAASRAFEANLAVIKVAKNMALQTLSINRR